MRRLLVLLPLAALAISAAAAFLPGAEKRPTVYRIECMLTDVSPGKPGQVLSKPVIQTIEGQPAMLQVGVQTPISLGEDDLSVVETGVTVSMTVTRLQDGRRKLDLNLQIAGEPKTDGDIMEMRTNGLRIVRPIPLGERVRMEVPDSAGRPAHRLDIVVSEVLQRPGHDDADAASPRARRRVFTSEDLRSVLEEWERIWGLDRPEPLEPFRTHGGIL